MTKKRIIPGVVIYKCPVYGCVGEIEIQETMEFSRAYCAECQCPMWPLELGYTGNDRDAIKEFAKYHHFDCKPATKFA